MSLGRKLSRGTKRLGHKINRGAHKLGHKTHDVLSKVQGASNKIVNKSENVLHKVRKGVDMADKIVGAAIDAGAGNVPVVGDGLSLLGKGLHGARKGLDKGDKALHKYKKKSQKVFDTVDKHANNLEKMNIRKKLAESMHDDDDNFA